ncbi:MAG: GTPase, partial [Desulfomonilaceae bacterium]
MARKLSEKARSDREAFYVGLIGGSGVGKSTLINAIAGKDISRPSDRRPFTDKIVAYRHKEQARGLVKLSDLFRDPDTVHENEKLKPVVIFDLPDIDSVETSNRNTVTQIIPHLDAVIWVASPEKYADLAFYSFVSMS